MARGQHGCCPGIPPASETGPAEQTAAVKKKSLQGKGGREGPAFSSGYFPSFYTSLPGPVLSPRPLALHSSPLSPCTQLFYQFSFPFALPFFFLPSPFLLSCILICFVESITPLYIFLCFALTALYLSNLESFSLPSPLLPTNFPHCQMLREVHQKKLPFPFTSPKHPAATPRCTRTHTGCLHQHLCQKPPASR